MLYKQSIYNIELSNKDIANSIKNISQNFFNQKSKNNFPLFNILDQDSDISEIDEVASNITENFDNLIVVGTGGSSLSGKALVNLNLFNDKVKITFLENIDPIIVERFFSNIDFSNTAFLIISKSGKTFEIISLFTLLINKILKIHQNYDFGNNFYVITSNSDNVIRNIAINIGANILNHDNIGGRFSIFTNVGLLPAKIAGLNIKKIRQGALTILDDFFKNQDESLAGVGASIIMENKDVIDDLVIMPYTERLHDYNYLYRQIWAESIGKNGFGMNIIPAIGTIDQHSQLQLYLDGPKNKFFTIITQQVKNKGLKIQFEDSDLNNLLNNLKGKTIGAVLYAEQTATISSLISSKSTIRVIELEKLAEEEIGGLVMQSMLETIIVAELLGINPFNQPAVEENKLLIEQNLV